MRRLSTSTSNGWPGARHERRASRLLNCSADGCQFVRTMTAGAPPVAPGVTAAERKTEGGSRPGFMLGRTPGEAPGVVVGALLCPPGPPGPPGPNEPGPP